eukprot:613154-Karenia_brevis.AAC.1
MSQGDPAAEERSQEVIDQDVSLEWVTVDPRVTSPQVALESPKPFANKTVPEYPPPHQAVK